MARIFSFFQRCALARRHREEEDVVVKEEFKEISGTVKGLIIEDNGLDVLYWRKLEGGQLKTSFSKVLINPNQQEKIASASMLPCQTPPEVIPMRRNPDPTPPSPISAAKNIHTPPPPSRPLPIPAKKDPPSPPALPKRIPAPPALPKRIPAPPPPCPKRIGLISSLKPPTVPRKKANSNSRTKDSIEGSIDQIKLKPLHWDKVIANVDHSMVWDGINDGSFGFDDELMENLFGYASAKKKSPERTTLPSSSTLPAQIFILDQRKSQNTAIVLRSLATSRKEIFDALLDGQGLDADTLEKLTKITPTQEEAAKILQFSGNPTKLADAESFLYHILKAVPAAFTRFNAMLFKSNYDPEILHLKECLQTLELGCKELRTRGIFLKLLEAILKAGNRMNAGTIRGNAQGFNLTALRKLSDVKSTDGKTTLLHFVVEQVVRSEGKRRVINQNHSQRSKTSDPSRYSLIDREMRDKEYLMLGLPELGSLRVEFINVKKAVAIDYDSFINMCSSLTVRVDEIQQLVTCCGNGERGGFVKEMKEFLEKCREELKVVREEQTRVIELVKRTAEYYQSGASKDKGMKPLHLFVIVKDFLDMVDQVCQDITQKLQKNMTASTGSLPPSIPPMKNTVGFPNLQSHFMSDKSDTRPSSDSEYDF